MSLCENKKQSLSSKTNKPIFLKNKNASSSFCGQCQLFIEKTQSTSPFVFTKKSEQVKKAKLNKPNTTYEKQKIAPQKRKSLKVESKYVQRLQNTATCSSNNLAQNNQKICNNISRSTNVVSSNMIKTHHIIDTSIKSYTPVTYSYQHTMTFSNEFLTNSKPFPQIYHNFKGQLQKINISSSKTDQKYFKIPMIESINHQQLNSSDSSYRNQITQSKQWNHQKFIFSKVKFISSVSGNLAELPISPVKQFHIQAGSDRSGFNSYNISERDNNNNLTKLRQPPVLKKQIQSEVSDISQKFKMEKTLSHNVQGSQSHIQVASSINQSRSLLQIQEHQVQINKQKLNGFGRYSVEIPMTKQFSNFKVKKTISLRDQQSSSEEQTSQVIYGYRKMNNMPVMEDILEDMQQSMMTKIEQKIENSNEKLFRNF